NPKPFSLAMSFQVLMDDKELAEIASRIRELAEMLNCHYGWLEWWPHDGPFEVMVGAILTQQTTWKNVTKAIENLKEKGKLDPRAISSLRDEELEKLVRPSGFYRQKAQRLKEFSRFLVNEFDAKPEKLFALPVKKVRERLLAINGIGPETADSMLLYAGDLPSFPIDAYTKRLLLRMGLVSGNVSYDELQKYFKGAFSNNTKELKQAHAVIVVHCQTFCRKNPQCGNCPIQNICKNGEKI
ncbi:MAG: hypothetical protein ACXQTP_06630, partial [Candidatus Methanofastidiosia archaeon]